MALLLVIMTLASIADYTSNSSIADEKQPWEYVGEMEFDFDTEEFAGPAFGFGTISYRPRARSTARPPLHLNGHLNPNSNNTSVQESATALRSFHRSRGVRSVSKSINLYYFLKQIKTEIVQWFKYLFKYCLKVTSRVIISSLCVSLL